jgi:hypothetical protein
MTVSQLLVNSSFINPLATKLHQSDFKTSSYRAVNTVCIGYKNE